MTFFSLWCSDRDWETAKGKPKNTLIIKEGNITKTKGQRQKLGDKQQWVYDRELKVLVKIGMNGQLKRLKMVK